MQKFSNFKKFIIFLCVETLLLLTTNHLYSIENRIEYKVNDEIITSVDIQNEARYLTALNPKLLEIDKDNIVNISTNSLIREKIKKIEIQKIKKYLEIDKDYLSKLIENNYRKINIQTEEEFINFLNDLGLKYDEFKKKIIIEALWNELIFLKFKSKVNINKEKLKQEILKNNNKFYKSYNLSEIFFNLKKGEKLENKFKLISKDIEEKGFENAALIHSISSTANLGGKLGWIEANSLNEKIRIKISKLKVNEFTNANIVPGGFLIINLNDSKNVEKKIDLDAELTNLIKIKTNAQLNQYSIIYFNKTKKNIKIEKI
tara:strand:- start:72 stop:1022 length:951 start_codon:yes stop_codon:yes gene_type:complete